MTFIQSIKGLSRGWGLLVGWWLLLSLPLAAQSPEIAETEGAEPVYSSPSQRPDSVFLALKTQYARALQAKDAPTAARCLQDMGRICYHLGHYPQALDYYLQAGKLFRELKKPVLLADNLNEIGVLQYYSQQPRKARQRYNEALVLHRSQGNKLGIAVTFGHIGHLFEKEHRYDSAFYYQRKALQHYQQVKNGSGMAKIYENLGSIYEDLERYDSARYYFQHALTLNRQTADEISRIEILNNLGDVLRKTGHYRPSLQPSREAIALALKTGGRHQLSGAYTDLAKAFNALGANDSAYHYLTLSRESLKQIYSEDGNKQLALLQTLYDLERKNGEIERLTNARRINRIETIAVVLGIVLLGALGVLVISRQRLKIRNERALREHAHQRYETRHELMQAELRNKALEEGQLKHELEVKARQLTAHTLLIVQKNQVLDELRSQLESIAVDDKRDHKRQIRQLVQRISQSFQQDQYWDEFRNAFEQVHQTFFDNLKKHNDSLTGNDLRLAALIKLNLSSNDIATLLGVSPDSLRVIRYRLRKKINLQPGESLTAFVQSL